ncbi:uncharacterized protein [Rutidosis leptorrhynchoides]|uniref:uncharacterized protein isoform X2 n=1 Tax=Rutidosis leptorrhynchoides TaxID=125765 RepID=UPI003A9A4FB6
MAAIKDVAAIPSRVNERYLRELLQHFPRLAGVEPVIPAINAIACSPPPDKVAIYGHSIFRFCLRLPFTPFFLEVCRFFGVAVGQFEPASIRKILIFEMYCHARKIEPSIRIFCHLVRIARHENGWFTFNKVHGFLKPAVDHPGDNWYASFIFINEDVIDKQYSATRVWRKYSHNISVTFPKLVTKENLLFKKIKAEQINDIKYGEHMLSLTSISQDWDISQGCACILAGKKKITPLTAMRSSCYSQLTFSTEKIIDDTPKTDEVREEEDEEEEEEEDIGMNRIASRERRTSASASHQDTILATLPPSAKRRRTGQIPSSSAQQGAGPSSSQQQIMLLNLDTNMLSSLLKGPPHSYEDFMTFLNAMNSEVTTNKELSAEKEKVTKAERIATEMKREYETMKRHYENCNSQRAEYKEQVKVLSFRETRHLSKIDELVKEKEKLVEENNILKEQLKAKEENEKRMITGIPALVERVFNCQALSHKIREFVHLAKSAERLNFFNFMKKKLPELPNPLPEVITSKINENAILEADEAGASIENIKFSDLENLCKRPDVTIDDVLNYTPQNE